MHRYLKVWPQYGDACVSRPHKLKAGYKKAKKKPLQRLLQRLLG